MSLKTGQFGRFAFSTRFSCGLQTWSLGSALYSPASPSRGRSERARTVRKRWLPSFSSFRQASAPHLRATRARSSTGQIRISLDNGLDCLMDATARGIPMLTGFTFATISSGRSRPACRSRLLKPLTVPTTSHSGRPRKRCSMMRDNDGEPTTRIVVVRNLSLPAQGFSSGGPLPGGQLLLLLR